MKRVVVFLTVLLLLWPALVAAETVVVEVLKASIKTNPSVRARTIAQVRRGEKLEVVKKERSWYMVRLPDYRTGWVFEYSVALVEESAEEEDLFGELEGSSRIRVTEATAAGSIRGLSQVARVYAENRGLDERCVRAVDEMQAYAVTQQEVDRFLREGQVGGR